MTATDTDGCFAEHHIHPHPDGEYRCPVHGVWTDEERHHLDGAPPDVVDLIALFRAERPTPLGTTRASWIGPSQTYRWDLSSELWGTTYTSFTLVESLKRPDSMAYLTHQLRDMSFKLLDDAVSRDRPSMDTFLLSADRLAKRLALESDVWLSDRAKARRSAD